MYLNRRVFVMNNTCGKTLFKQYHCSILMLAIDPEALYEMPWTGPMLFSMDC